jgi:hypothetical protein
MRLATKSRLPARSSTTLDGSAPTGQVAVTASARVSITESVSSQELVTNSRSPIRREREAARHAAHRDVLDDRIAGRIQHAHLFALLAEHVEPRAVGRKQNLKRRSVVPLVALVPRAPDDTPAGQKRNRENAAQPRRQQKRRESRRTSPHPDWFTSPSHFGSSTVSTRSTRASRASARARWASER